VSRDSGEPAGEQVLSKVLTGTRARSKARHSFCRDAQLAEGFRLFVCKHVEAGETGGILDTIRSVSHLHRKERQVAARVKSALVYPVGVLTVAGGVITLPALEGRADFRHVVCGPWRGPPVPTKIVIALSNFIAVSLFAHPRAFEAPSLSEVWYALRRAASCSIPSS